ncbi:YeiH family protein [Rhodoferax ferrireducens]|uniref:YeiH family protein n=1 Tax=Rhodoferax ferrireducens TaxID=192843 RepID=UPI000E0D1333|nr:putative sulfate exporter family transporter [Rhodoferax ferrireducens]
MLSSARPWILHTRGLWPGLALPLLIMLGATFISEHYGGPQLLYALLFGVAFHFLYQDARCRPGIEFCAKTLLRIGVALLGARITLSQIGQLGIGPLATAALSIVSTIALGAWLARRFGLTTDFGLLCGAAVSICGASAALAVSAVMPKTQENERHTLLTVVGVTGLSTLAMIFYPLLVKMLLLSDTSAGIFLGGTIHDVAQVIGAGLLISHETGDVAVIVKLFRVTLLVPVVAVLAYYWRQRRIDSPSHAGKPGPLLPFFLIGFMALVLINSSGVITPRLVEGVSQISRVCLVIAIAALGIKTSFEDLVKLGWRPMALMLIETLWLAAVFVVYLCVFRR